MYEPWVTLNNHKFPFRRQETAYKAALLRDVAKFCLCIQGKDYNFSQGRYAHLRQIPTRYSESEIRRFVEETFKLLQFEEALNAETPTWQAPNIVNGDQIVLGGVADVQQQDAISDQPLHVELGTPGSVQDIVEVHDQTAEGLQELQYDNGTQLICASFELPGVEDHEQPADMVQELQHVDGLQSICANLELAGPTIEENIREHPEALISSAGPSLIQRKGTSEITVIAPCNGTGDVDLFTELKVFRKEKWTFAVVNFAPESYAHEGCSATMHKFVILRKSGDTQELSWSVEMEDKLYDFQNHGWKIQL
ncbi:unnamed protein product [Sphagnum balticum]